MSNSGELEIIHGNLGLYAPEETASFRWVILDSEPDTPITYLEDKLHVLRQGDLLTVFNRESDEKVWQGVYDPDYSINVDKRGYQWVMEHAVVGLQKDMPPGQWAEMFFNYLPATLVRKIPEPNLS